MSRSMFGGSEDDYAVDAAGNPARLRRVHFYTSAARTTEITDLASDAAGTGSPLTVTTDSQGFWGPVYGPSGTTVMYAAAEDAKGGLPTRVVAIYPHTAVDPAGTYRPDFYTVANLLADRATVYVPHSGTNLLGPDNTLELFAAMASAGFGAMDGGDLYAMTGCNDDLAVIHDTTVDFSTTASGNTADQAPQSFRGLTVDSSTWFGQGWPNTTPVTFLDLVQRFGNRIVMFPEIKVSAAGPILLNIIQRYRLQKSVVVCSQIYSDLAPFVAAGIEACYIASNTTISGYTPAQLLTDGVNWLQLEGTSDSSGADPAPDATFTTFVNGGVKVLAWTLGRQWEVSRYVGLGCKGALITSPYAAGDTTKYRRTTDPLVQNRQYHAPFLTTSGAVAHDATYSSDHRGSFGNGKHTLAITGGAVSQYVLQAWASPLANAAGSYTLDADFIWDTPHTDTSRFAGFVVGALTDKAYSSNSATDYGYECLLRETGALQMFRRQADGTAPQVASGTAANPVLAPLVLSSGLTAGTPITSLPVTALPAIVPAGMQFYLPTTGGAGGKGQTVTVSAQASAGATSVAINSVTPTTAVASAASVPMLTHLRVAVTPTTVTLTRTDSGASVVATDSSPRGGYFYVFKNGGGAGTLNVSYQNVAVT